MCFKDDQGYIDSVTDKTRDLEWQLRNGKGSQVKEMKLGHLSEQGGMH